MFCTQFNGKFSFFSPPFKTPTHFPSKQTSNQLDLTSPSMAITKQTTRRSAYGVLPIRRPGQPTLATGPTPQVNNDEERSNQDSLPSPQVNKTTSSKAKKHSNNKKNSPSKVTARRSTAKNPSNKKKNSPSKATASKAKKKRKAADEPSNKKAADESPAKKPSNNNKKKEAADESPAKKPSNNKRKNSPSKATASKAKRKADDHSPGGYKKLKAAMEAHGRRQEVLFEQNLSPEERRRREEREKSERKRLAAAAISFPEAERAVERERQKRLAPKTSEPLQIKKWRVLEYCRMDEAQRQALYSYVAEKLGNCSEEFEKYHATIHNCYICDSNRTGDITMTREEGLAEFRECLRKCERLEKAVREELDDLMTIVFGHFPGVELELGRRLIKRQWIHLRQVFPDFHSYVELTRSSLTMLGAHYRGWSREVVEIGMGLVSEFFYYYRSHRSGDSENPSRTITPYVIGNDHSFTNVEKKAASLAFCLSCPLEDDEYAEEYVFTVLSRYVDGTVRGRIYIDHSQYQPRTQAYHESVNDVAKRLGWGQVYEIETVSKAHGHARVKDSNLCAPYAIISAYLWVYTDCVRQQQYPNWVLVPEKCHVGTRQRALVLLVRGLDHMRSCHVTARDNHEMYCRYLCDTTTEFHILKVGGDREKGLEAYYQSLFSESAAELSGQAAVIGIPGLPVVPSSPETTNPDSTGADEGDNHSARASEDGTPAAVTGLPSPPDTTNPDSTGPGKGGTSEDGSHIWCAAGKDQCQIYQMSVKLPDFHPPRGG